MGQSCIADIFVERFKTRVNQLRMGDPKADSTGIAPMARIDLRDELHAQVEHSLELGPSVWTSDVASGQAVARKIHAGCTFVNGIVKNDPCLPIGGVKESGYGRVLSKHGIREFVNTKTVWVK